MICEICKKEPATQIHHVFPNTRHNRKTYGRFLINHRWNTQWACDDCNVSHAKARNIGEREFCKMMKILRCEYCYHDLGEGCLRNKNYNAEYCRAFKFDLERY